MKFELLFLVIGCMIIVSIMNNSVSEIWVSHQDWLRNAIDVSKFLVLSFITLFIDNRIKRKNAKLDNSSSGTKWERRQPSTCLGTCTIWLELLLDVLTRCLILISLPGRSLLWRWSLWESSLEFYHAPSSSLSGRSKFPRTLTSLIISSSLLFPRLWWGCSLTDLWFGSVLS